jgi:hypothetical protein
MVRDTRFEDALLSDEVIDSADVVDATLLLESEDERTREPETEDEVEISLLS